MANVSFLQCKVEDEYGVYPNALIGIYNMTETSTNVKEAEVSDGAAFEEVSNTIIELTFKGNYWQSAEAQAAGKRSRPLSDNGNVTVKVDLTSLAVVEALSGAEGWDNNLIDACKVHAVEMFQKKQ